MSVIRQKLEKSKLSMIKKAMDTGQKLHMRRDVQKMSRTYVLNVLYTFNLHPIHRVYFVQFTLKNV